MQHLRYLIVVMLLTFLVSGCATIVTGFEQEVTFDSEPTGAVVTVSGKVIGTTPVSVLLSRGRNQPMTIEKEGYKTYTAKLSTKINPFFWGNLTIVTASAVDGFSGAMYEFSPNQYFITLTQERPLDISISQEVKNLIIAFGSDIRLELASSGGEMTDALLSILSIGNTKKDVTITALNELEHENKDDLEFAMAIIDVYDVE